MKTLILILFSLTLNAQYVLRDTLYVVGEEIHGVQLLNKETSKRTPMREAHFGVFITPLRNLPRGNYVGKIVRSKRPHETFKFYQYKYFDPINGDYVEKYYYEEIIGMSKRMGYADKEQIVKKIESNKTDMISFNGRNNSLKVYQIINGVKELVYEK